MIADSYLVYKTIKNQNMNSLRNLIVPLFSVAVLILPFNSCSDSSGVLITGEEKAWHTITFTFDGPSAAEYDTVNPFTDYRFEIEFTDGQKKITAPGYFASDGDAAETSARSGNKWRAHFCPPSAGTWTYRAIFLKGKGVAVSAGQAVGERCFFDGTTGTITVGETDKQAPDFRAKGRLQYYGDRYLRYSGTGEPFLKGGADSPENFLGYKDFDGTYFGGISKTRDGEAAPNRSLHSYGPHIADWKTGDPEWKNGKGRGIIGALNYLSSKGMNSVYFLTLNILGDGEDVWPYTDRNERYRFDCSKLDQWEIVFDHMDSLGMMIHFVLQETENECLLDNGYTDVQRKLYLRELVARFGHHLAVTWNIGEENGPADWTPIGQTDAQKKAMMSYLKQINPYPSIVVLHTHADNGHQDLYLNPLLGFENLDGPSLQIGDPAWINNRVFKWVGESGKAGKRWSKR